MEEFENEVINAISALQDNMKDNVYQSSPIKLDDGNLLIPMNKITLGYMSGNNKDKENSKQKIGANALALSVTPIGYIVSDGKKINKVEYENKDKVEKWKDLISAALNLLKKK